MKTFVSSTALFLLSVHSLFGYFAFGQSIIECTYDVTINNMYRCNLRINNPAGENFLSVGGSHLPGRSDNDVQVVTIFWQNTRTFPSVLCQQFVNIREISVMDSNLEIVTSQAFQHCRSLVEIDLSKNRISSIPANLFSQSPNLAVAELTFNTISQIHQDAFVGTALRTLDLGNNFISSINSAWFSPIRQTLTRLNFLGNMITSIPDRTFIELTNLDFLMLGRNRIRMGNYPFEGLQNLRSLRIGDNGFVEINPLWFAPITRIEELFLCRNGIGELPPGVFGKFSNLQLLRLNNNLLSRVEALSFGSALGTLNSLQMLDNFITSFDPQIIIGARNLNILMLEGNICINENFSNVAGQVSHVLQRLQGCI